nr:MAG TPA: hypothetical protein [Caudoviricetes sp.]
MDSTLRRLTSPFRIVANHHNRRQGYWGIAF